MRSPVPEYLQEILDACAGNDAGAVADYIPELAAADPEPFALAMCTPDGTVYSAGDAARRFTLQSLSKPFVYALALRDHGSERVEEAVDMEPSGDAFNEISLDPGTGRPENPMINIGAITTHTLVGDPDLPGPERAERIIAGLGEFAGRDLEVDDAVRSSELATSWRNQALANLVKANGILQGDPYEAVAGYTRQCAVLADVRDLAVMAMTLGSGGVNPLTGRQVVPEPVARQVLAVMTTCGMYDAAGDWLTGVGIPAKSGVSGGLLGVLPGQVGLGAYSPRLDVFGHSVRGVEAFERLSEDMGLHIMRAPAPSIDMIGQRSRTRDGRRLVALQGALTFPVAEMALRHFEAIEPGDDDVVVDFTLVPRMADVGIRMIGEGLERLSADGHDVILVDPHGRIPDAVTEEDYIARVVDAQAELRR